MVKFINRLTGNVMWVAEERVEEYEKAGHKKAIVPPAKKKPTRKKGAKK